MKKTLWKLSAILLVTVAAGCETTGDQGRGTQQGASVTRNHFNQPIARGEIRVEPIDPNQAPGADFPQIAAPVERELTRLGWTVTSANLRSEQVAFVGVSQGSRASDGGDSVVVTELRVRLRRRSDASFFWEGRAELEARADSPLADRRAAVDRLAEALFQDFPGESGVTIRVR